MQPVWTHYKLSTGEAGIAVLGEFPGGQSHGLAAVAQFAGDEETDGADQLEMTGFERRTQLYQETINVAHSQWKHVLVTLLRHTHLYIPVINFIFHADRIC